MTLNGTKYIYETNAQGDVTGLLDSSGSEVVTYSYDTWGKLLGIGGSLASTVGALNPFRYRGYYYDTETGLYYLNSRYYDPNTGRYLNADSVGGKIGELAGSNVFAYANNNPVMMIDPSGHWSLFNTFCVCLAVTVLVVCILQPELIPAAAAALAEYGGAIATAFTGAAIIAEEAAPEIEEAAPVIQKVLPAAEESSGKTAVIGETMGRVESAAQQIGAETYGGLGAYDKIASISKPVANFAGAIHNAGWIISKMANNYTIVDIGIDSQREVPSFNYAMERVLTHFYQDKSIVELFFE